MADRVPRLLLVLLHLCGVERGEVGIGRLGTLLGPEGTGASLVASGRHDRHALPVGVGGVGSSRVGGVVAADHGEPVHDAARWCWGAWDRP